MTTENDSLVALMGVLADPAVTKARAKELLDAAAALDKAKEGQAQRLKDIEKAEAEANALYKQAAEAQLNSKRDLASADARRKEAQAKLDEVTIREAEISHRLADLEKHEALMSTAEQDFSVKKRALDERVEAVAAQERSLAAAQQELNRKLMVLKSLAA